MISGSCHDTKRNMLALCSSLVVQAAANDMLPDHNIRKAFIKQRSSLEEALGKKNKLLESSRRTCTS